MLDPNLTKDDADDIYNSLKYVNSKYLSWNRSNGYRQKIFINIKTNDGLELEVQGWYSWKGSKRYGFALLYKNNIPIRRWDDAKGHIDSCSGKILEGPHKHYYHPIHGDNCAYETKDIRQGDVNGALLDFLKECHISMGSATYQTIEEPEE